MTFPRPCRQNAVHELNPPPHSTYHCAPQHASHRPPLLQRSFAGQNVKGTGSRPCTPKSIYLGVLLCAVVAEHKPGVNWWDVELGSGGDWSPNDGR